MDLDTFDLLKVILARVKVLEELKAEANVRAHKRLRAALGDRGRELMRSPHVDSVGIRIHGPAIVVGLYSLDEDVMGDIREMFPPGTEIVFEESEPGKSLQG